MLLKPFKQRALKRGVHPGGGGVNGHKAPDSASSYATKPEVVDALPKVK